MWFGAGCSVKAQFATEKGFRVARQLITGEKLCLMRLDGLSVSAAPIY